MDLNLRTETFGQEDLSWLGSDHGTDTGRTVSIDVSTFTANTHFPQGFVKGGLPLGRITGATENGQPVERYGLYSDAATDGRQTLAGVLYKVVKVTSPTAKVSGSMLQHCFIRESRLPVPIDAAGKADVVGRIIFNT